MREKISEKEIGELMNLLNELILASDSGAIIIVEGRSDKEALRKIGVRGKISMASTMSDAKLIDTLFEREQMSKLTTIIILTDWDREGKLMERKLNMKLKSFGFDVNVEFRKKLFKIIGKDVKTIEDLPKFIENLRYLRNLEKW